MHGALSGVSVTLYCVIRPKCSHDYSLKGYRCICSHLLLSALLPPAPPSESLQYVFGKLGFKVKVHKDLTADGIRNVLKNLGKKNFYAADVLVSSNIYFYIYRERERERERENRVGTPNLSPASPNTLTIGPSSLVFLCPGPGGVCAVPWGAGVRVRDGREAGLPEGSPDALHQQRGPHAGREAQAVLHTGLPGEKLPAGGCAVSAQAPG